MLSCDDMKGASNAHTDRDDERWFWKHHRRSDECAWYWS